MNLFEKNSLIAKNTLMLYFRTIIILVLALYTSRLLLATLGVKDFGIYYLVSGVLGLFSSLKGVFASSVQRFINYEKGVGSRNKVHEIFCVSVVVHIVIALFFAVIVELFGVWFITYKLNIPNASIDSALRVFHCSVLAACIMIISVPYDAVIIANEKMNAFALIAILDAILKFFAIFVIKYIHFYKVEYYALLLVLIALFVRMINILYCRHFPECKFKFYWNYSIFKQLASFAGWNFFGNTMFSLVNEGINMMLNIYGGVVANAARGIAYQVKNAVGQLTGNILIASQPSIIQQSALKDYDKTFYSINRVSKLLFFIIVITVLPIIIYCDKILTVWLVEPPIYAITFTRLILIYSIIRVLHGPIDLLFKAIGKIGMYQIIDALTLSLSIPLSYICLYLNFPIYYMFIVLIFVEVLNLSSIIILANYKLGFSIYIYFKTVLLPGLCCVLFSLFPSILFYKYMIPDTFLCLILCIISLYIVISAMIYLFVLDGDDKRYVRKIFIKFHA